ncbi:MAG: tRNA-uridine aminocarboxypropyltransferase [Deltaproteobacteria bacterium]|nr:tRNA-uridine aminocarboxypropyltransferase [Deltaproteobacteria bacterium]
MPRDTCWRCYRPAVACICAALAPVVNRTGVTILQHPRERFHAVGTARIARLGLRRVRVETCFPWTDLGALAGGLPARTALLYPSATARELAELPAAEHPQHLVVLDGTWFLAKKLYDGQRWLHRLPHVSLTPARPSGYGRVRREPRPGYIATIEAIVAALRVLEPQTAGLDGLLDVFAGMVERQAEYQVVGG